MLAYDPATNPLNTNEWAFPLTEVVHIASMALAMGTIGIVDLRLLGFGLTSRTAPGLLAETEVWTIAGLALVLTSGMVIFSSDPFQYAANPVFRFKIAVLFAAILYNYTIRRMAVRAGGALGILGGSVSLLLWLSVVFGSIFIAF